MPRGQGAGERAPRCGGVPPGRRPSWRIVPGAAVGVVALQGARPHFQGKYRAGAGAQVESDLGLGLSTLTGSPVQRS